MPLPDGLKFLAFGWWMMHIIAVALVFWLGYRKGWKDRIERERLAAEVQRAKERQKTPPGAA